MGRNSRQRRAARQRKRPSQGAGRPGRGRAQGSPFGFEPDPGSAEAFADLMLVGAVQGLGAGAGREEAERRAEQTLRTIEPIPLTYARRAMRSLLDRLLDPALRGGWGPADLAEAVDRKVEPGCREVLAGLLLRHRPPDAGPGWAEELAQLGAPAELPLRSGGDWGSALRLAALFGALPSSGAPSGARPSAPPARTPRERAAEAKLSRVRALLAKAESTPYPEEAEALSAKAQELIAKYSLERLLGADVDGSAPRDAGVTYRRMWLDAPYVGAKASLVHEVASANRCRAVFVPVLDMCTVVGTPFDLDAVGLLVTSLLSQAQRAMLAHGRVADRAGTSRTRSFRQSFLTSFAYHIGKRLRAATDDSLARHGERAALIPVIADQEETVSRVTDALFPSLVNKQTAVSNAAGWAGGRAAAELALLDIYGGLNQGDERPGQAQPGALGARERECG